MATYRDTKGYTIETVTADPVPGLVAWSSGGNVNEARYGAGSGGTRTAAFIASGYAPTVPGVTVNHEQYDGTTWSEAANLANGRNYIGSAGTATAALAFAGYLDPGWSLNNEEWNGTSWSEKANLTSGRYNGVSFGTSTAAIFGGGAAPPSHSNVALCEQYDGSSWTEVANLNTARGGGLSAGTGIVTAGIFIGDTTTEQWNGSSWTEIVDLNTTRCCGMASGTSTVCIFAGGPGTPRSAVVESFDGTSWTTGPSMSTGRNNAATGRTAATSTATLVAAGSIGGSPDSTTVTEEYGDDAPYIAATVVKEGQMWYNSAADALKVYGTGGGISTAAWASGGNLNDGRSSLTGIGIQTATVAVSGQDTATTVIASVEEYNGTAWTEVTDIPVALKYPGAGGILTAGWVAGGLSTAPGSAFSAETYEYDGTNWTDSGNINTTRYTAYGGGPQTAAFIAGGNNTSFAAVDDTELYDGSSWTEVADLNTARANAFGNGTQTDGIYAGGPPTNTATETWNGTSWTEQSDLSATNSSNGLGISGAVSAITFGGFAPTPSTFATVTEEFTAALSVTTVTVS